MVNWYLGTWPKYFFMKIFFGFIYLTFLFLVSLFSSYFPSPLWMYFTGFHIAFFFSVNFITQFFNNKKLLIPSSTRYKILLPRYPCGTGNPGSQIPNYNPALAIAISTLISVSHLLSSVSVPQVPENLHLLFFILFYLIFTVLSCSSLPWHCHHFCLVRI